MKLLTFQAREFGWTPFSQTIEQADEAPAPDSVTDAVVAFMHIEASDLTEDNRSRAFKKTLKHLKWLANKREMRTIVLHSFTHLGGENADPDEALAFMTELAERLVTTGYVVKMTPFGWFSAWNLDVYGESLAKVWKAF